MTKIKIYFFLVIVIIISFLYYLGGINENSLKNNTAFTYGHISDLAYTTYASGKKTSCEYTIANKTYTAEFHHNNYCYPESEEEKAIFKKLPIVIAYDSTNAKISRVLISLELMREFNYALDDSLKGQYEKFFFKCQ